MNFAFAQLNAPVLKCVSVLNASGDVQLNWIIPADPSGTFSKYEIYKSVSPGGPFSIAGTVTNYVQNSFVVIGTSANVQSQYFYVKTVDTGNQSSAPSDTLRSIFLNIVWSFDGVVRLNWNKIHNPLFASSASTFTLSRELPANTWTPIYTGSNLNYNDTMMLCSSNYNYKLEIADATGCSSLSNIIGGTFMNLQRPPILQVDSVSVDPNTGYVTIGWEASYASDVSEYIIYQKNNLGVLVAVDTVYGRNNTVYTYTASSASSTSEIFSVVAGDSCGNLSIPNVGNNTMLLSSGYDLCGRTVNLSWTAYQNMINGILRYDIYASVNGGPFSIVGNTTSTNFSHTGLNSGDTYCYYVRVWNGNNLYSASSNKVCELANTPQAPSYVYVNSVSVTESKQIQIVYTVDITKPFKGVNLFKSTDGVIFTSLGFNANLGSTTQFYIDTDVKPSEKRYYYKVQITDSCGNPASFSNVSHNIILQVKHDEESLFYNQLTWDDYGTWLGNVASYNIYRAVNGLFDPTPIANVNNTTFNYRDDVQDFVSDKGKFGYYVEAVEGAGNTYGFNDKATSNRVDTYVEAHIFVPNAFAPKGLNNVWLPVAQYVEKTDYTVRVFDRWGTKVFETNSDTEGWTGNGATDDVYVYLIDYKNARGEYIQIKGHLNIVR